MTFGWKVTYGFIRVYRNYIRTEMSDWECWFAWYPVRVVVEENHIILNERGIRDTWRIDIKRPKWLTYVGRRKAQYGEIEYRDWKLVVRDKLMGIEEKNISVTNQVTQYAQQIMMSRAKKVQP